MLLVERSFFLFNFRARTTLHLHQHSNLKEKFMADLKLSEIWIYPIKSLGGISLQQSQVFEKGLQHDRRWMLVDETGQFMTQRIYPQMAHPKFVFRGHLVCITYHHQTNHLPFTNPPIIDLIKVTIWDDSVL